MTFQKWDSNSCSDVKASSLNDHARLASLSLMSPRLALADSLNACMMNEARNAPLNLDPIVREQKDPVAEGGVAMIGLEEFCYYTERA